jgi:hypothetical protein
LTNRRIRDRTYGGVGGGRRKASSYPIPISTSGQSASVSSQKISQSRELGDEAFRQDGRQ